MLMRAFWIDPPPGQRRRGCIASSATASEACRRRSARRVGHQGCALHLAKRPTRNRPVPQQTSPQRNAGSAASARSAASIAPAVRRRRAGPQVCIGNIVERHARHALHDLTGSEVRRESFVARILTPKEHVKGPAKEVLVDEVGTHLTRLCAVPEKLSIGD